MRLKKVIAMGIVVFMASSNDMIGFEVVKDGIPKSIIIVPAKASDDERLAASELQKYIMKSSGAKLKIIAENENLPENFGKIFIGKTEKSNNDKTKNLPENFYRIKIEDNQILLYGNAKGIANDAESTTRSQLGTLYAVYEFIDRKLGGKWLWPGETGIYIPRNHTIDSGPSEDMMITPRLLFSRARYTNTVDKKLQKEVGSWFKHHRFCQYKTPNYGHAFVTYWKKFGAEHPEWFALAPDGKRGPIDERIDLVQMCVSNPELHKQIVADWLKNRSPEKPWINCAENDKRGIEPACHCEQCRTWDSGAISRSSDSIWAPDALESQNGEKKERLSLSDRYAKFYLAVQKEAMKYDKDATIVAYAYAGYTDAPINVKLNKNIIVWIVPPYTFPLQKEKQEEFRKLWDGWEKTGARLILRPNYFWSGYCMPYIFAEEFGNEFKYALDNGLEATDFDSLTGMWGVQGPNLYMMGRLHSRPELTVQEVMDEYYSAFGNAKDSIKDYWNFWQDFTRKNFIKEHEYGNWLSKYADKVYTPEVMNKAQKYLDEAKIKESGDEDVIKKISFLENGLEHTRRLMQAISDWRKWRENPFNITNLETFHQSVSHLYAFRERQDVEFVINPKISEMFERFDLQPERDYYRFMIRCQEFHMQLLEWDFKWGENNDDENAIKNQSDISSWQPIEVGKSWKEQADSIKFDGKSEQTGWYITKFSLPTEDIAYNHVYIMFGAVDKSATIWLNEERKWERIFYSRLDPDMWQAPFFIALKKEELRKVNTLVVKVQGQIKGGGIWKPVYIFFSR